MLLLILRSILSSFPSERGAPHSTLKGQRCLCHPSEPEDPETALAKECREDLHLILVFVSSLKFSEFNTFDSVYRLVSSPP